MRREEGEDIAYHIQSNHTAVYAPTPISAYHRVLKCQKMATETNEGSKTKFDSWLPLALPRCKNL